jgi:hypothetical protein
MKFSRAISRVKLLSGEKPNVSKTISVPVLRVQGTIRLVPWERGQRWSSKRWVFHRSTHLTRLIARKNFIILSRRESNKSHYRLTFSRYLVRISAAYELSCLMLSEYECQDSSLKYDTTIPSKSLPTHPSL